MKLEKIRKALEGLMLDVNLGRVVTDKATLVWDSDEDLRSGDYVRGEDTDGNEYTLEDGDYTTSDGKVISVEGSKVIEIRDKKAEVAPEDRKEEALAEIMKLEATYDEKARAIYDAFHDMGRYGYVVEAADTYAVFYKYDENYDTIGYVRFDIEWVDGKPVLSNEIEVKPAYVPVAADAEKVSEIAPATVTETTVEKTADGTVIEKTVEKTVVTESLNMDGGEPVQPDGETDGTEPEPSETGEDRMKELEDMVGKLEDRLSKVEEILAEKEPKTVEEEFRAAQRPKGNGKKENNLIRFVEA